MGRLTNLKPMIAGLGATIAPLPSLGSVRDAFAYRRWYKTARWQRLRAATLKRDNFTCGMCGRVEGAKGQLVADHRQPHRGDASLFWDPLNLWALCKSPCHDSVKQREERSGQA